MRIMQYIVAIAIVALPTVVPGAAAAGSPIEIDSAFVRLIEQVEVPAREAGVLAEIAVREGQTVAEGALLARIEDREPSLLKERAAVEREIAASEAKNDVRVRFAKKSLQVAQAELQRATESVQKYDKSVSETEIDHLRLTAERSALEVEQAQHEVQIARLTAKLKQTEMDLATASLERRRIVAPAAGMVVQVYPRAGEWVQPGQKVLRLVQIDRLRVEGFVSASQIEGPLVGSPVRFVVDLPGKKAAKFAGEMVFVSPEVDPVNGQVRVWAEIDNRDLVLRPGLRGRLTIQTGP